MKQGIVSAGFSDCNHCEGIDCSAPSVLPSRFGWTPKRFQQHHTHCSNWNGCIAVIERPLRGSGDFICVLLWFLKPSHSDGFGEQLLGITKRP